MRIILTAGLLAGIVLGASGGSVLAAASDNASCNGLGSSAIGPLGARDDASHQVKDAADALGIAPGQIFSSAAHEHLGSAQNCLAIPA
ncbi:MAG: hypothetical protein JOZ39_12340 [Chloroflexi bacterium]|nr:hypothetical protein [Chloroflexota bacterium]